MFFGLIVTLFTNHRRTVQFFLQEKKKDRVKTEVLRVCNVLLVQFLSDRSIIGDLSTETDCYLKEFWLKRFLILIVPVVARSKDGSKNSTIYNVFKNDLKVKNEGVFGNFNDCIEI